MKKNRTTKNSRKIILISMFLALCLVITLATVAYAQHLSVTASVPPHYTVEANGNNLFIETNMKVFINSKEITY
jgi:hypothetical protein